jgi:Zn-dependent protease
LNGIPVARLLGFEIRIHPSWILIVALIGVTVVGQLEVAAPDLEIALRWAVGALVAALFFASAVAHELGHAIVARRRGLDAGPITIHFFGGSASFEPEADNARDEAAIALAGPTVSLAVGAIFVAFAALVTGLGGTAWQGPASVAAILGTLNLMLGAINLLPAYPLDGGRLARAVAWARTGDARLGVQAVARSGRIVGWGLVGAGLLVILLVDALTGVMLGAAGWFLSTAATQIERRVGIEALLDGVRVDEIMERDLPTIPPQLTVDTFAERVLGPGPVVPALPVVRDDELLGLVAATRLRRLRRRAWQTTRAAEIMVGPPELRLLAPDALVWPALEEIRRSGLDGLPVVGEAGLLGVLTRRSIAGAILERQHAAEAS